MDRTGQRCLAQTNAGAVPESELNSGDATVGGHERNNLIRGVSVRLKRRDVLGLGSAVALGGLSACAAQSAPAPTSSSPTIPPASWQDAVMRGPGGTFQVLTAEYGGSNGREVLENKLLGPVFNRVGSRYGFSVNYSSWLKMADQIYTSAAAANMPDLQMVGVGWVEPLAQQGLIAELPADLLAAVQIPDALLLPCRWRGGLYAVPQGVDLHVLAYRRDFAQTAGLSASPQNLDELRTYAKALTAPGRVGIDLFSMPLRYTWTALVTSYGGQLFRNNGMQVAFTDGTGVKALDYLIALVRDGSADPTVVAQPGQPRPIAQDRAAIDLVDATAWGGFVAAGISDESQLGLFALPHASSADPVILQSGTLLTLAKAGPNQSVGYEVIDSLLGTQAQLDAAAFTGHVPVTSAAATAQQVSENRIASFGWTNVAAATTFDGGSPAWLGVIPDIEGELMSAIKGQQTSAAAVDNIAKLASLILGNVKQ